MHIRQGILTTLPPEQHGLCENLGNLVPQNRVRVLLLSDYLGKEPLGIFNRSAESQLFSGEGNLFSDKSGFMALVDWDAPKPLSQLM